MRREGGSWYSVENQDDAGGGTNHGAQWVEGKSSYSLEGGQWDSP